MIKNMMTKPKYNKRQQVYFVGGTGKVLHYRPDAGKWSYIVEMEMGSEPSMGRVGAETRLILDEADLQEAK